jgi:Na+/H+-dicarboxylate symporter
MKFPWKFSLFQKVILGVVLGIIVGILIGEPAGKLGIFGTAYVRLLQMTVLPYVVVSLVGGIGRLNATQARIIGSRGGALILFLWGIGLAVLTTLPVGYPDWTSASFFSTTLLDEGATFDPLQLYLTSNPFHAMANTIVPATVMFSIVLGVALIGVPHKQGLLDVLENLTQGLMRVASAVAKLTPYGLFAITANAAGTLRVEELGRLQVYLWVYVVAWAVLMIMVLPSLVAWGTPFSYREVIRQSRTAIITAIATGTVLVVLPLIAEKCKELLEDHKHLSDDAEAGVDVLVPTAYSFPSIGTLLGLGFILFAAWFAGSPLDPTQYPGYVVLGLFTAFGTMNIALPYLLDFFRLPADLFQLYLLGSVVTARLATGLAAMHGVVICLLGASAVIGIIKWRKLFQVALAGVGLTFLSMVVLGFVLSKMPYTYKGDEQFVSMRLISDTVRSAEKTEPPPPLTAEDFERSRLDVIRGRGSIRVGYMPDRLPMAFRNNAGQVVGFDVELAHLLAADIGVQLELVRLEWPDVPEWLRTGRIDMLAGGIVVTPDRALEYAFTRPYGEHTMGLIVLDHRRNEFSSTEKIEAREDLVIGLPGAPYFRNAIQQWLPDAQVVVMESPRPFLRGEMEQVDAIIFSAERGSAWTLIYPDFTVAVPRGIRATVPIAFGIPREQEVFRDFLNNWLTLKIKLRITDDLFDHWILGKDLEAEEPRWSVIRNVFGWGMDDEETVDGDSPTE